MLEVSFKLGKIVQGVVRELPGFKFMKAFQQSLRHALYGKICLIEPVQYAD